MTYNHRVVVKVPDEIRTDQRKRAAPTNISNLGSPNRHRTVTIEDGNDTRHVSRRTLLVHDDLEKIRINGGDWRAQIVESFL